MPTEWDGGAYEAISALQRTLADDVLGSLVLRGDERVLDVGCGDGRVTASIADRVPRGRVVGVDPSRRMVGWGTTHDARRNLAFAVADARALPFSGAFDFVTSFNALHWIHEQETALRQIRRALRPGGRAVVQQVPDSGRPSLEDVIERTARTPRWAPAFEGAPPPYCHVTPDAYRAFASTAGFRVDDVMMREGRWDFGSRDAFVHFADVTFVAWTSRLPGAEHRAFIGDVLDAYAALLADPADAHAFRYWQMRATLTAA